MGKRKPAVHSKVWCIGRTERNRSWPMSTAMEQAMQSETMFQWVSITPFGTPVVPEVKIIAAMSSLDTLGNSCLLSSPALAISSSMDMTSGPRSTEGHSRDIMNFGLGKPLGRSCMTSRNLGATKAALTSAFAMSCCFSLSLRRESIGTLMQPAKPQARYALAHSGEFGPRIATRSPFFSPRDKRPLATALTSLRRWP